MSRSRGKLFLDGRVTLRLGNCLKVVAQMAENSVDAIVCDPPYHLASIEKRFGLATAKPAKLGKSGAYNRAARGFMGKQWDGGDIAFQARTWKAMLRVLKPGGYIVAFASSRGFGRMSVAIEDAGFITHPMLGWIFASGFPKATKVQAPGYEGFRYGGQALKPALEPIYVGQKPFSERNGTTNILRWGTGAMNIDECRVATADELRAGAGVLWSHIRDDKEPQRDLKLPEERGRWPANLLHDGSPEALAAFPDASGQKGATPEHPFKGTVYNAGRGGGMRPRIETDTSSARFFYSAKATLYDRLFTKHPTVKPLALMQWLCRLVTPPGGVILDPFAGTGTTGEAAWREGMQAILIERETEYQADIAFRMNLADKPTEREAVVAAAKDLRGAEGTPLFAEEAAE